MKLTRDLQTPWLIHLKGALFILLGLLAATLLIVQLPTFKTAALLGVAVWAFCRFYYYLFYVLEKYLGREARFSGIFDAVHFLLTQPSSRPRSRPEKSP